MTLPLTEQDRERYHGPRYDGNLASIHDDIEFDGAYWVFGLEFTPVGDPPPFPWAGQPMKEHQCRI